MVKLDDGVSPDRTNEIADFLRALSPPELMTAIKLAMAIRSAKMNPAADDRPGGRTAAEIDQLLNGPGVPLD